MTWAELTPLNNVLNINMLCFDVDDENDYPYMQDMMTI